MTVLSTGGAPRSVLVTDGADGQGRSALAAVRALAAAGYEVSVTTSGAPRDNLAAASRHCVGAVLVPPATQPGYAQALSELMASWRWGWVVPASDIALLALRPELASVVDKAEWGTRAEAVGFKLPPTVHAESVEALGRHEDLTLPLVLKPTVGRFPARRIDSREELLAVAADGPVLAQPYLTAPLRSISVVVVGGRLVAAVHQRYLRIWPVQCGTASLAVTAPADLPAEARLLRLLDGFDGIAQLQLAGTRLLDVNARVYGSMPLAMKAGVNLPDLAITALRGDPLPPVQRPRTGIVYRWIEGDLRHLLEVARSGTMTPTQVAAALLPHGGAAHSVASLHDPVPLLTRLRVASRRGGERAAVKGSRD